MSEFRNSLFSTLNGGDESDAAVANGIDKGSSRRDLLKKAALVGAVAWTLPAVISSPAFAASKKCGGSRPCTTFYFVKVNGDGTIAPGVGDGSCGLRTILKCDSSTATLLDGGAFVTSTSSTSSTLSVTLAPGVVPLLITTKYGPNCHDYTYNEGTNTFSAPNPATACTASVTASGSIGGGLTILISSTGGGCGISHVNFYFCR